MHRYTKLNKGLSDIRISKVRGASRRQLLQKVGAGKQLKLRRRELRRPKNSQNVIQYLSTQQDGCLIRHSRHILESQHFTLMEGLILTQQLVV